MTKSWKHHYMVSDEITYNQSGFTQLKRHHLVVSGSVKDKAIGCKNTTDGVVKNPIHKKIFNDYQISKQEIDCHSSKKYVLMVMVE